MLFITSCSSGPDAQIDKLEGMYEKQNELADEKGYKSKETIKNYMELDQYREELIKASEAEGSEWTPEQKERLQKVCQTPVLGESSTIEGVMEN